MKTITPILESNNNNGNNNKTKIIKKQHNLQNIII